MGCSKPTPMGKQDRKQQILELAVESNIAFSQYIMYQNLQLRGATFSYRTVKRLMSELRDEGLLEKIEFEERQSVYIATEKAHQKHRDTSEKKTIP
jgi:Fe2+ or Zn2+ uptake regulation protein